MTDFAAMRVSAIVPSYSCIAALHHATCTLCRSYLTRSRRIGLPLHLNRPAIVLFVSLLVQCASNPAASAASIH